MKNQAMNENVKATVSTTYFTFNHLTRKIVGTELNFKKSGTPGSAHDIELMARIAEHPNYDFLVIKPEKEKNSYKGLKRELVHDYIDCFGSAEQMAEFEKMKDETVRAKESEKMTLSDYYHRDVPDYYDWMYLDGYTPEQIMYAKHKQMYQDSIERKNTQQATEPEVIIPRIIVKSVVNIK